MGPLELLRRVAARVTGEYLNRFKSGEYPPDKAVGLIKRAIVSAPHLRIADATDHPALPDWIEKVARAIQKTSEVGHLLIVVDSIHAWAEMVYDHAAEYDALNLGLSDLRRIASRLNCPVLGVAERNRTSMQKGGLSAGAGSRKFEYKSESVLDLKHEKEGPDAEDADGWAEIKLAFAKNRNGAKGKVVKLRFHGAMQKFDQRTRGW
jgi:replicative DNA helicase